MFELLLLPLLCFSFAYHLKTQHLKLLKSQIRKLSSLLGHLVVLSSKIAKNFPKNYLYNHGKQNWPIFKTADFSINNAINPTNLGAK